MGQDWIVVIRKVRDTTSRGKIVYRWMSEQHARRVAKELGAKLDGFNVWAMRWEDY